MIFTEFQIVLCFNYLFLRGNFRNAGIYIEHKNCPRAQAYEWVPGVRCLQNEQSTYIFICCFIVFVSINSVMHEYIRSKKKEIDLCFRISISIWALFAVLCNAFNLHFCLLISYGEVNRNVSKLLLQFFRNERNCSCSCFPLRPPDELSTCIAIEHNVLQSLQSGFVNIIHFKWLRSLCNVYVH